MNDKTVVVTVVESRFSFTLLNGKAYMLYKKREQATSPPPFAPPFLCDGELYLNFFLLLLPLNIYYSSAVFSCCKLTFRSRCVTSLFPTSGLHSPFRCKPEVRSLALPYPPPPRPCPSSCSPLFSSWSPTQQSCLSGCAVLLYNRRRVAKDDRWP